MTGINNLTYLSQRDPRWANTKIGNSNTTIGRYGCAITCLSMISQFFGCYQLPDEIAKNAKNFEDDSIVWIQLNFPKFSFRWREGSLWNNAENKIDMEMLKSYMAGESNKKNTEDRAVMLEVANRSHWVLALWPTYDDDILAIDPWTGKTCEVLKTYGNITGASLFVKWTDKTKGAWRGKMSPVAPDYS